ncbi:MAG TPA: SCP2 sterol-binding domain-containing protein, partial [Minicystis sp.]|nr:SCP2 sterol-binding domain-containing protein [Minicystis sp.]
RERLAKNASLAKEVDAVIQFHVTDPAAEWVADMKRGEVRPGTTKGADVTLTLADADLAALVKGGETPQRLYQTGKLRIDGDIRVATSRLGFLKGLA